MEKQSTIAVGLIINEKDEILLPRRNQPEIPEIHDKLEFPGGGIEFGEDPEQALLREIKEETGLEVKIVRLLPKVFNNVWDGAQKGIQVFILAYECKPIGGELKSNDPEVGELKYYRIENINYSECLPKVKEMIELLK